MTEGNESQQGSDLTDVEAIRDYRPPCRALKNAGGSGA